MDRIYGLPYTRKPHPMYKGQKIPAYEVVKDSVTIMRGCFGGCTFCSITAHQGRIIQSRSSESVLDELRRMGKDPEFSGTVSDIGGPTANMYQMRCTRPEVEAKCKRLSCVHPKVCKLLGTDHGPLVDLMRQSREVPGRRQGLRGLGYPDGPRPEVARVSRGAGPAPRRRPSEGGARAHRFQRPAADEEARRGRLRGFRDGLQGSQHPRRQEAIRRAVFHRVASRQRPERDDRPGAVPQAERPSSRPGAGLHPGPVRHRHVHVLHGARPVHGARGSCRSRACGTARCSGR